MGLWCYFVGHRTSRPHFMKDKPLIVVTSNLDDSLALRINVDWCSRCGHVIGKKVQGAKAELVEVVS